MTKAHAEVDVVRSFFGSLWEEDPAEGTCLVLWGGKGGAQRRCRTLDEAAQGAAWLAQRGQECYYGVALQDVPAMEQEARRRVEAKMPKAVGPELTRGYVSTAAAIPGLWLDIDIEGDGHAKKGLPTWADVDQILAPLPEPTFRAATGGGLHVYWLFREPWYFDGPEERDRAATLLRRWQRWAAGQGFALDSANDLARVLRPVGAWTSKRGRLVELMGGDSFDGPRYNPSDLEELAERFAPATREVEASKSGSTSHVQQAPIRPAALEPETFASLMELQGFAVLWANKAKTDSPSEAEFRLARFGALAGLSDDQIAGMVVEWGRTHRSAEKLDKVGRIDYLGRTIQRARETVQVAQAKAASLQEAQETLRSAPTGRIEPQVEKARQTALEQIGAALGLDQQGRLLERIFYLPGEETPAYVLVVSGVHAKVPGGELLNYTKFSARVSPVVNYVLNPISKDDWLGMARAIQAASEVMGGMEEDSPRLLVDEWVGLYIAHSLAVTSGTLSVGDDERIRHLMLDGAPFELEGVTYFAAEKMTEWLRLQAIATMTTTALGRLLRQAGYSTRRAYLPGTGTRRRLWTVDQVTCARVREEIT